MCRNPSPGILITLQQARVGACFSEPWQVNLCNCRQVTDAGLLHMLACPTAARLHKEVGLAAVVAAADGAAALLLLIVLLVLLLQPLALLLLVACSQKTKGLELFKQ